MSGLLLVRGARQLLTLRGPGEARRGPALSELGIIEDGAVLTREGFIVSVGPTRRVENLREAREADVVEATGRVVMPGLVDCHTYFFPGRTFRAPPRPRRPSAPEDASAWSATLRGASRRRILWECRRWLHEMLRHGTTTAEVKSGWGLDQATELRLMRILARLQGGPVELTPTYSVHAPEARHGRGSGAYLEFLLSRLLPLLARRRMARFVELSFDPGHWEREQLLRCLSSALEMGFRVKIRAAPGAEGEAISLAVNCGATSVEALTRLSAHDIGRLAASPVIVTLLPALCLTGENPGPAAVRELIRAGAAVALASGHGGTPTFSLPAAMALACLLWDMAPAEAITAATINAACALGLQSSVGSLEPGKQADMVIFDVPDYREIPYYLGVNLVSAVLKRGVTVYHRGEVLWNED